MHHQFLPADAECKRYELSGRIRREHVVIASLNEEFCADAEIHTRADVVSTFVRIDVAAYERTARRTADTRIPEGIACGGRDWIRERDF
jgi:hypothetical protein